MHLELITVQRRWIHFFQKGIFKKDYYERNVKNYAMKPTPLSRLQYLVQLLTGSHAYKAIEVFSS